MTQTTNTTRLELAPCQRCGAAGTSYSNGAGMVYMHCSDGCEWNKIGPLASLPDYRQPEFQNWNRLASSWNARQRILADRARMEAALGLPELPSWLR